MYSVEMQHKCHGLARRCDYAACPASNILTVLYSAPLGHTALPKQDHQSLQARTRVCTALSISLQLSSPASSTTMHSTRCSSSSRPQRRAGGSRRSGGGSGSSQDADDVEVEAEDLAASDAAASTQPTNWAQRCEVWGSLCGIWKE